MRRLLLPFLIICIAAAAIWYVKNNAPQSKKRPSSAIQPIEIDSSVIKTEDLQLSIHSFGQISAKHTANITAQVSGLVTLINPALAEGAFFKKGELLLSLDNRDYQSTINSTRAFLTQVQQALALEKAQVSQAKADWRRLNKTAPIPALVSRTPQVISAKAKVSAAFADYNKAILNYKRTQIYAPFNGRVLTKHVNIGDYVNANSALAEIFSTAVLQVKLNLKNSDLAFIDLPEGPLTATTSLPDVRLEANLIEQQFWRGKIVRTAAAIDQSSQQLYVIAEIPAPFSPANAAKHPLKIGQYVRAEIQGKRLKNAISIDIKTVYQGQFVLLVKEGVVRKQNIKISWQDDNIAVISQGLAVGDRLVTSLLSADAVGSAVRQNKTTIQQKLTKKQPQQSTAKQTQ